MSLRVIEMAEIDFPESDIHEAIGIHYFSALLIGAPDCDVLGKCHSRPVRSRPPALFWRGDANGCVRSRSIPAAVCHTSGSIGYAGPFSAAFSLIEGSGC